MCRPLAALLVTLAMMLWGQVLWAQSDTDRASARELFFDGTRAADAGDHAAAEKAFRQSSALYPAPTSGLGLARALAALGRLVEAHEVYREVLTTDLAPDAPDAFATAIEHSSLEYRTIGLRLGRLVIVVTGPRAPVVTVDGEVVPTAALGAKRLVDPGSHDIHVAGDGFKAQRRTIVVAEGDVITVPLELEALTASPPPPTEPGGALRPIGFVALGIGGASLIAAAPVVYSLRKRVPSTSTAPRSLQATSNAIKKASTHRNAVRRSAS